MCPVSPISFLPIRYSIRLLYPLNMSLLVHNHHNANAANNDPNSWIGLRTMITKFYVGFLSRIYAIIKKRTHKPSLFPDGAYVMSPSEHNRFPARHEQRNLHSPIHKIESFCFVLLLFYFSAPLSKESTRLMFFIASPKLPHYQAHDNGLPVSSSRGVGALMGSHGPLLCPSPINPLNQTNGWLKAICDPLQSP